MASREEQTLLGGIHVTDVTFASACEKAGLGVVTRLAVGIHIADISRCETDLTIMLSFGCRHTESL